MTKLILYIVSGRLNAISDAMSDSLGLLKVHLICLVTSCELISFKSVCKDS